MKKISEILKKYKKPLIWSICYTCVVWAILYFLFNFDMFNGAQWHRLAHSQLRGFPGFVFGILILSAIPLYVATTVITARKNEYLVTLPQIKIPNIIKPNKPETKQPEPAQPEPEKTPEPAQPEIPDDVPHEIRTVYARALRNMEALQFNQPEPEKTLESEPVPESEPDPLPLPSDFDISFTDTPGFDNEPDETVPVFTDINFDTTEDSSPNNNSNSPEYTFDNSSIIAYFEKSGQKYTVNNNVVITDKFSIITHSDTDFWVTDPENWFATGKTCPSPIAIVKYAAEQNGTVPVIYLASTNIMDLESLIPQWESDGIIVITDINKL